jgi:hypothetical protein
VAYLQTHDLITIRDEISHQLAPKALYTRPRETWWKRAEQLAGFRQGPERSAQKCSKDVIVPGWINDSHSIGSFPIRRHCVCNVVVFGYWITRQPPYRLNNIGIAIE